jgi:hypothetical protein
MPVCPLSRLATEAPDCVGNRYQQQLSDAKNPYGYCPDHGTGVSCSIGIVTASGPVEALPRSPAGKLPGGLAHLGAAAYP